jgi:hypothetical protein
MSRLRRFLETPLHRGVVLLAAGIAVAVASGAVFLGMRVAEPIVAGPGVTRATMLSEFAPGLEGGPGDTPVFVMEGEEEGGTFLLIGGCHPQEISGLLAAVLTIENARVARGRIVVVPEANRSGFSHTEPLEGFPHRFTIDTPHGPRRFRNGMRLTNPAHQWPDPELYIHHPSGEPMIGLEARNLNRNFPGRPRGRLTERVGHGLLTLGREMDIDLVLDMHEAYPEYPIINMMVAHERAFGIATMGRLMMQMRGISMDLMASPPQLRGLSHREFGDHTNAYAVLSETANPLMGRFRGRTDERLLIEGRDPNYVRAAGLGLLFVPFTEEGHPLDRRVARQLATIEELLTAYNEAHPDRPVELEGLPTYEEVVAEGIGAFLLPAP